MTEPRHNRFIWGPEDILSGGITVGPPTLDDVLRLLGVRDAPRKVQKAHADVPITTAS
jgi:hypothetical protein